MKFIKRRPPLMLIVTLVLLALLPMLAVLQYRWVGQVSRSERERMQASLRAGMAQCAQDFDREITRAYVGFQISPALLEGQIQMHGTLREKARLAFAERFERWQKTAPYPQLVKDVFLVESGPGPRPALAALDPASRSVVPAIWPDDLSALRERFESEYREVAEGAERGAEMIRRSIDPIIEDIPALVIPLPMIELADRQSVPSVLRLHSYMVVRLDLDYIKERFIPELAARYFSSGGELDYNLIVARRDESQPPIYRTDGALGAGGSASADAAADLFSIRFDELNNLTVIEDTVRVEKPALRKPPGSKRLSVMLFNSAPATRPVQFEIRSGEGGRWLLMLKHRAGSLESVVAAARRQNLIVSFGILLLLAISVGTILIATRRAERLAKQQMEFVAGVSHELRTPLAVICSAGENLADGVVDNRAQMMKYGSVILSEGRRLSDMVEQVLEFAGIQSGRKSYELRATDVGGLIEGAVAACLPLIEEGRFAIEKEVAADLPPVLADALAINRAIQNLLSNALKYGGEDRRVRIIARAVLSGPAPEVWITVEDNGQGIADGDLPHIFEPFYRGRQAVAAQIRGNGLGLSLVKHILEAHGGRVSVESGRGAGSSFTLHLIAATEPGGASTEIGELALGSRQ